MLTSDTDASLKCCSTPPLWHIDAVGRGVHPIINSAGATMAYPAANVYFAPTNGSSPNLPLRSLWRMPAVVDRSDGLHRPASAKLQCTKSRKAERLAVVPCSRNRQA